MTKNDKDKLIAVGVLKGAHGVRGEVRVKSLTGDPEAVFGYGPLLDEAGAVLLTPKSARPGKDHFIVRPKEQKQKEDWDALRGRILHVPRAALPAPDEGEFYIEDLAGMDVYGSGDSPAGRVRAVQDFGAGDLLEIELTGQASTIYVPFTEADVPVVDIPGRRLVIPDLSTWATTEE